MIKPLTSLRFLFAFCVFLHHYCIRGSEVPLFPEGYFGVSFFFILSGFIISYNYEQKILEKTISLKEFFVARFARIYPLHLLTFLAALVVGVVAGDFFWQASFFNIALLQSFIPIEKYHYSFNAVSWSISNELFFYLMFPILIKINKNIFFIFLPIYFIAINIIPEQFIHAIFYVNPIARIIDFIIGIGIFYIYKRIKFTPATFMEILSLLILFLALYFSEEIPSAYRYASYYWIPMAFVILTFSMSKGYLSKILSLKPFVIAGEISFGFYMLHTLVIRILKHFIVGIPDCLEFIVIFSAVVIVSLLSFYFFEKPVNKWIKKWFQF